jgi:hypothetical protein
MRREFFISIIFVCIAATLFANEEGASAPYQIPQTVYIGDKGRLVYPLDGFFSNQKNGALPLDGLDTDDAILISSIEIDNGRLVVDFQAFRTGAIPLPVIVINGEPLSGLEVYISSLLDGSDNVTVLSPAAAPLSAPGTLWIVVSIIFIVILIFTVTFLFLFRGGNFFSVLQRRIKKARIIRKTQKAVKKLKINLEKENISARTALSGISNELRVFLDNFFNTDCRSMVPLEFLDMVFPDDSGLDPKYTPRFFYHFFENCDKLRFSGGVVTAETVRAIILEVETLTASIKLGVRR